MDNKTVIICCAGAGNKLGIGVPKALLKIGDKPLIIHLLEKLNDVDDVRIVVGYQANKVIDTVLKYRKDVSFIFNRDYNSTGPAASAIKAFINLKKYTMIIDGDLLVDSVDFYNLLKKNEEFICGSKQTSKFTVGLKIIDGNAVDFEKTDISWIGICNVLSKKLKGVQCNGFIYEVLKPLLPLKYSEINAMGIDTMDDYDAAKVWMENNNKKPLVLGILGGMGTYATINLFKEYAEVFPAIKEWERPRIIIDNNCTMPSRVRAYLYNENVDELVSRMYMSMKNLINSGANRIILACNTSHLFLNKIYEIDNSLRKYVFNIIQNCCDYLLKKNIKNVYLLGTEATIDSHIYQNYLEQNGINVIVPAKDKYSQIRLCIEAVKQNKFDDNIKNTFVKLIECNETVILGCTELPVLYDMYREYILNKNILDPLRLALECIKEIDY